MPQQKTNAFDLRLFKRLLTYIKPYKLVFIGSLLCVLGLSAFGVFRPKVVQMAVDEKMATGDYDGFLFYIILMVVLLVLEVICQLLFIYYASWLGQTVVKDIRIKLFKKMTAFKMKYFDKSSVGVLITRPGTEEYNARLMEIITDYQSLVMMLYIPLYAMIARLVFYNKKKYNFTELLVVFLYLQSQISIITFFLTLLAGAINLSFEVYTYAILFPFQLAYFIYSLKRLYELDTFSMIIKTVLFSIILFVLIVLAIIFVITVLYLTGDLEQMFKTTQEAAEAAGSK